MDDEKNKPMGSDDEEHSTDGTGAESSSFSFDDDDVNENPLMEEYEEVIESGDDEDVDVFASAEADEDDEDLASEFQPAESEGGDYEFLDEEVDELELNEEAANVESGGFMDMVRSKLEPLIGEDNFDRLKGMAIPIVVVAIFFIFALSKLSSLFATPTPQTATRAIGAPTQITQIKTPSSKAVTKSLAAPSEKPAGTVAVKPAETDVPAIVTTAPADSTTPALSFGFNPGQPAAQSSAQTGDNGVAAGIKSLWGGDAQTPPPSETIAMPSGVSDNMIKLIQKDNHEQAEKVTSQLTDLDEQAKGLDERLLRLEKMQESLDKKMMTINSQLEKVGESLATLSNSLKSQPVRRQEIVYHQQAAKTKAPRAAAAHHEHHNVAVHDHDTHHGHEHAHAVELPKYRPHEMVDPGYKGNDIAAPGGVSFETPYYHVEAVVPGRAWLKDQSGTTITVSKGDQIRGYGYVTHIDPENGVVATSSGIVIRYGIGTH